MTVLIRKLNFLISKRKWVWSSSSIKAKWSSSPKLPSSTWVLLWMPLKNKSGSIKNWKKKRVKNKGRTASKTKEKIVTKMKEKIVSKIKGKTTRGRIAMWAKGKALRFLLEANLRILAPFIVSRNSKRMIFGMMIQNRINNKVKTKCKCKIGYFIWQRISVSKGKNP